MNNIIRNKRIELKMTQKELAIRCNVRQSYISQLENYKKIPSLNFIIKISKILDLCPLDICNNFINCPFKNCKKK